MRDSACKDVINLRSGIELLDGRSGPWVAAAKECDVTVAPGTRRLVPL